MIDLEPWKVCSNCSATAPDVTICPRCSAPWNFERHDNGGVEVFVNHHAGIIVLTGPGELLFEPETHDCHRSDCSRFNPHSFADRHVIGRAQLYRNEMRRRTPEAYRP